MPEILAKWLMTYIIPVISITTTDKVKKKETFGLSMESEQTIKCLSADTNKTIQLAKGDQFQLHGIYIPRLQYGKVEGYDYFSMMSTCDMLETGLYGPTFPLKGRNVGRPMKNIPMIFNNIDGAKRIMENIIRYICETKQIHEILNSTKSLETNKYN
jgi:hypothetical protein